MKRLATFFLLFAVFSAFSQTQSSHLPYKMDKSALAQYRTDHNPQTGIEMPPNGTLRPMAEWEELEAVWVAWEGQTTILTQIVKAVSEECRAIVSCDDPGEINSARNILQNAGINMSNVDLVDINTNTIWIRDYAPNCVYQNDVDTLILVDWIYNRNRPSDDLMATEMAQQMNIPLYSTTAQPYDLVHTGGNFMSDGIRLGFSSELVLEENDGTGFGQSVHDEPMVDSIMRLFMGVEEYVKMDNLPYDEIHHIDMHMKLLDEETLLVGEYPDGIADGPQIEANLQYVLSNFKTSFGTDFKVIRIPMPPHNGQYPPGNFLGGDYRTYANSIIVNKSILVPFYEEQFDTTAQRIWEEAMPGYNIVGINCNSIIPQSGAIHCITKEVGVKEPLRIVHQELLCQDNFGTATNYDVSATVQHRSGIESVKLLWATNPSGPFQEEIMTNGIAGGDEYYGAIPTQPVGSTVYYYIEAEANDGKTMRRPMVAPEGTWSFCVEQTMNTETPSQVQLQAVFPNPASAVTCVPVIAERSAEAQILLLNALGQATKTIFQGTLPKGESKYFFSASDLPSGVYWVQVRTAGQSVVQKIMVNGKNG